VKPVVMLLMPATQLWRADRNVAKLVRDKPDLVQRFVDASIEGWASYLNGDPRQVTR
jgi:NitT/TauT family transport system substrate-binding protein